MDAGKIAKKKAARARRRRRGGKTVVGTSERPRLVVHRSLRNIEAQIIGRTDLPGGSLPVLMESIWTKPRSSTITPDILSWGFQHFRKSLKRTAPSG